MTNREKLRAMSNAELAERLDWGWTGWCMLGDPTCDALIRHDVRRLDCEACIERWLGEEAEDDD